MLKFKHNCIYSNEIFYFKKHLFELTLVNLPLSNFKNLILSWVFFSSQNSETQTPKFTLKNSNWNIQDTKDTSAFVFKACYTLHHVTDRM